MDILYEERTYYGRHMAVSEQNDIWYAYIDKKFVHQPTFSSKDEAIEWCKYEIRRQRARK